MIDSSEAGRPRAEAKSSQKMIVLLHTKNLHHAYCPGVVYEVADVRNLMRSASAAAAAHSVVDVDVVLPTATHTNYSHPFVGANIGNELYPSRAVVVAQLVEWSLPIPEVCGSNPVIGKILY